MKKSLVVLFLLILFGLPSNAKDLNVHTSTYVDTDNESYITMENIWIRNGKYEEKVINIGSKLLYDNKINKRVPFRISRDNVINASSSNFNKIVTIHKGIFPYIDNDDEMAFVIGHEISHSLDAYGGVPAWLASTFNSKHYEYKSDLTSIDMMVKSGYNPVAAITCSNKFMAEPQWDFGFSHPKASKRLLQMYKYIRVKYPDALRSSMAVNNIHYINFKRAMDRDIKEFEQKKLHKELQRQKKLDAKKL